MQSQEAQMAFYNRRVIDLFANLVEELTMDEIRDLDNGIREDTSFDFAVNGQEWVLVHDNHIDEYCRDYLRDQVDDVEDMALRDVEEHLKHLVTFDREGYIDMELDGGYEYVLAHYDHTEHELDDWFAYRQG